MELISDDLQGSPEMETDPVSETLCFLVFRIPEDGQSPKIQYF
jgi:hypothetical protein